jgi:hypothetical protein
MGIAALVILNILLAGSCVTTTVWDDSIPPEESSKVMFVFFKPTSFNGIPIKGGILIIPAGAVKFCGDVKWTDHGYQVTYTFKSKDANFSCELEGGKEYTAWVTSQYDEKTKARTWGVSLYHDIKSVGYPKKENLIAFIPFDPLVLSN